jgi:hypothetical protein
MRTLSADGQTPTTFGWWKKALAAVASIALLTGAGLMAAESASAHNPTVTATCTTLSVSLSNYTSTSSNTNDNKVAVTINGATQNFDFKGSSFSKTFAFTNSKVNNSYEVKITAWDAPNNSSYSPDIKGTTTGCAPTITKDASAAGVVLTAATCTTGQIATPGDVTEASWNSSKPTTGPGSYSYTATAVSGHEFSDGTTTKSFSGTLAGPTPSQSISPNSPCYTPPTKDASAAVTVTPATCTAAATAVPGTATNASWTGSTAEKTGPGSYSYTAKAQPGHLFSDGTGSKTFTGTLAGVTPSQSTKPNSPCYTPPPMDAKAAVTVTPATCSAAATAVPGTATNASWIGSTAKKTGPGPYSYTAKAKSGHQFADGTSTDHFSGTLDGAIGYQSLDQSAPCYTPPPTDAKANVVVTQATCTEPATAEPGDVTNASWTGGTAKTTGPASYSYTATAKPGHAFSDGTGTEPFSGTLSGPIPSQTTNPDAPCYIALTGSTATGTCVANAPWIYYDVTLTNKGDAPLTGDGHVRLVLSAGGNTDTLDLGKLGSDGTLKGKVLWPGASVAADGVTPTGWPGWEQDASGKWVQTSGNFAWTRDVTSATLEVNPSLTVALAYPPATPNCDAAPPTTPTVSTTPAPTAKAAGLADTGSDLMAPLAVVLGLLAAGGAALVVTRVNARRRRS